MSALDELRRRIDVIEKGYEYLLAYAAQGRQDDQGSDARRTLSDMHAALEGLGELAATAAAGGGAAADVQPFLDALGNDARVARGAIALVLSRAKIPSLLVDNLNASVHVRALLTDLFLIDQALKTAPAA
ncbi:MAG: hypothetical protein DIU56_001695 [Pseudomonadota bacterium]|nr:MAG: hypothetical protein DIU56_04010 [Pseudomonadota bacterium]